MSFSGKSNKNEPFDLCWCFCFARLAVLLTLALLAHKYTHTQMNINTRSLNVNCDRAVVVVIVVRTLVTTSENIFSRTENCFAMKLGKRKIRLLAYQQSNSQCLTLAMRWRKSARFFLFYINFAVSVCECFFFESMSFLFYSCFANENRTCVSMFILLMSQSPFCPMCVCVMRCIYFSEFLLLKPKIFSLVSFGDAHAGAFSFHSPRSLVSQS